MLKSQGPRSTKVSAAPSDRVRVLVGISEIQVTIGSKNFIPMPTSLGIINHFKSNPGSVSNLERYIAYAIKKVPDFEPILRDDSSELLIKKWVRKVYSKETQLISDLFDNISLYNGITRKPIEDYLTGRQTLENKPGPGYFTRNRLEHVKKLIVEQENILANIVSSSTISSKIGGDLEELKTPTGRRPRFVKELEKFYPDRAGDFGDLTISEIEKDNPDLARSIEAFAGRNSISVNAVLQTGKRRGPAKTTVKINLDLLSPEERNQAIEWAKRSLPPSTAPAAKDSTPQ